MRLKQLGSRPNIYIVYILGLFAKPERTIRPVGVFGNLCFYLMPLLVGLIDLPFFRKFPLTWKSIEIFVPSRNCPSQT